MFRRLYFFILLQNSLLLADFSVTPLLLEFAAEENKPQTLHFTVRNTGKKETEMHLYGRDFLMQENGQEVEYDPKSQERSCAQWMTYAPSENFLLQPGEEQDIRVSMSPEKNASGIFWSKLFVEEAQAPSPISKEEGSHHVQLLIKQRWEVRLHQVFPGTLDKSLAIQDMHIEGKEDRSLDINIAVSNQGSGLLRCQGALEIKDMEGNALQTLPLGSNGRFGLYPKMERKLHLKAKALEDGEYVALLVLDYGADQLMAGELEFSIGNEEHDD
ncbi:MAG: hypothetical protein CMO81_02135 [Waddliaceae bacterium]|nr:hypothetical protein [Waddliaceae bacterium]